MSHQTAAIKISCAHPIVKRAAGRSSSQATGLQCAESHPKAAPLPSEVDVLIAIAREINTHSEPQIMVQKLADALTPYIRFDTICLSTVEDGTIRGLASSDPDYWIPTLDRKSEPTHFLWPLIDHGEMFDLSITGVKTRRDMAVEIVTTYINVPLIVAGRVFGLLHIDSYRTHQWSEAEIKLARLVGGQIAAVVQGAQELKRRRAREAELAQSLALLHATQEAAAEGICLVDPRGEVVSFNRKFAALWDLSPQEAEQFQREARLMTHVLEQLADPDEFIAKIGELYDNPDARARDEIALRDGRTLERYSAPAVAPATPDRAAVNCGRVWTFADVSNRKLHEAQLQHQAFHDALTGLPNRVLLVERIERARLKLQRSRRALAVLFLDLDRFKIINDSLGHDKGDQLLKQVAARLQSCLRPGDTAARFGGDEFVVLLEEVVTPEDAAHVARRIAASLQVPFDLDGSEVTMTTSVGIVISHSPGEAPDELMRKADIAMYRAKNNGKAQFYLWSEGVSESTISKLQLEIELQGAIKRGELEVWYQPLIDLRAGQKVGGFEALVRWRHPERGLVSPADFIPIAEESGLIAGIDAFVLRVACAQIREWNTQRAALSQREHAPLSIHVNLSARQFENSEIVALVARILGECELPAQQLVLEITESALMLDTDKTIDQLRKLKQLGVGLAIDDFGTGYSSLAYLEFLPMDSFKIDRAFVARMGAGNAIVRAIVSLAEALHVEVVAEGVETALQLQQLQNLRCQWAQGFLFSKPLPAAQLHAMAPAFAALAQGGAAE